MEGDILYAAQRAQGLNDRDGRPIRAICESQLRAANAPKTVKYEGHVKPLPSVCLLEK